MSRIATPPTLIEVRRVADRGLGGRGVFATTNIVAGTLIERSPVLLIPEGDVRDREIGRLHQYVFGWDVRSKRRYVALGLGYLSLYNHQVDPNADWETFAPDLIDITARRDLVPGEEISIHYHGDPGGAAEVGFKVIGAERSESDRD